MARDELGPANGTSSGFSTGVGLAVDLRPAPGLQLIQVVLADHDVPAKNLVLRDTGLVVRIAVANPVERRLRLVVGDADEEHAAKSRLVRSSGKQNAVFQQLALKSAMRLLHFQHFVDWLAVADNTYRIHAIRIFVTSGTFDKEYDEITGRLFFKDTHVPEMLRLGRSRLDAAIKPLMLIDSLDMTDADRQRVVGLEVRA